MGKHTRGSGDDNRKHLRKKPIHDEEIDETSDKEETATTSASLTPTTASDASSTPTTITTTSASMKPTTSTSSAPAPATTPTASTKPAIPLVFDDEEYKRNLDNSVKSEACNIFHFLPNSKEVDMSNFVLFKQDPIAGDSTDRFKLIYKGKRMIFGQYMI